MFWVTILYMLFASTFTLGKAAIAYVNPIFFVGVRMTLAGILLLAYLLVRHPKYLALHKKDIWLFVQIILFHIYISYTLEFWALQYMSSSKTCLLYNLSPFVSAFFSYFMLSEKMRIKQWLGLIIGFVGFLPILIASPEKEEAVGNIGFFSLPEIMFFGTVVSSAYAWIIMKRLVSEDGYSPVFVNGIGMLGGGILALITSLLIEGWPHYLLSESFDYSYFGLYLFLSIFIGNVICYNMYGALLKSYSATFLSFAGFMTPLFAAVFGYFFLNEHISFYFLATVGFVFIGLYLYYADELKQGYRQDS